MLAYVRSLAIGLCLVLGVTNASRAQDATRDAPVVVFAASSLKESLDAVAAQWRAQSGSTIVLSYAASSALVRQIEAGAPADLLASADLEWMDYAEKKGLIRPETRTNLLGNQLVLVAAAASPLSLSIGPGFDLAGTLGEGRLAVGDVKAVPAGKYAKAALENLGVWPAVEPKLAMSENVRAALALVSRGEAPLGIVYATDAKADPGVKVVAVFPATSHPAIVYPFALTASAGSDKARDFLAFLRSPAAQAIFKAAGFERLADKS